MLSSKDWISGTDPIYKELPNLPPTTRAVRVYGNTKGFRKLSTLSELEELYVYSLSRKNSEVLSSLVNLKRLFLRWGGFTDLVFLRNLKALNSLIVWQTSRLITLDGIESLENLQELTLFEATSGTRVLSLQNLEDLSNLSYLQLRGPMTVESLSPLLALNKLSKLELFAHVQDRSLAPLKGIPNLAELDMWILEKGYPLEEMAVAAAIAPNLLGKWLNFQPWGMDCKKCGTTKLTLIGRGTRSFCPLCQPNRGEKFAAEFKAMVNQNTNE